jgi:hypothetical protein
MVGIQATVDDFLADCKALNEEEFIGKHPTPILVESEIPADDKADDDEDITSSFSTMVISGDSMHEARPEVKPGQQVLRVAKRGQIGFASMIAVGRTSNNDIVIDSQAISKFHAHFTVNADTGTCTLTDAASTNGTFVNSTRLEPRQPCQLSDGDEVSFAQKYCYIHYTPAGWYRALGRVAADL